MYLDQNAWIALAQGCWDKDRYPAQHAALSHVIDAVRSERLLLPLSQTNLFETLKINDPTRRAHLAYVQTTLSSAHFFRGRRRILKETVLRLLSESFSLKLKEPTENWYLSRLFIEAAADYSPELFGPEISADLVQLIRDNPESALFDYLARTDDAVRRAGVKLFSAGSTELLEAIQARRSIAADQSFAVRRRAYSARLVLDEFDFVLSLANSIGLNWATVGDLGEPLIKSLITHVPIMNVECELVVRLEDQKRAVTENDLRDVASFAIALPFSDILVGEKLLVNIARQARLGGKYDTVLLTSVTELLALEL